MKNIIVAKIGGSVFSDKAIPYSFREEVVNDLAAMFAELAQNNTLAIVLGGGSHGHAIVKKLLVENGELRRDHLPIVSRVMEKLVLRFTDILDKKEVHPLIFHPHSACFENGGRYLCDFTVVKQALHSGIPVVTYGDAIISARNGTYILSGDDLAVDLARLSAANIVYYLTNVDGILDDKGEVIREIRLVDLEKNAAIRGSSAIDVTGGMKKKIESLKRLRSGVRVCIMNGLKTSVTRKSISNRSCGGTLIHV